MGDDKIQSDDIRRISISLNRYECPNDEQKESSASEDKFG